MMNYRELNAYVRTASGARYPIEGHGDYPSPYDLALAVYLCCFEM